MELTLVQALQNAVEAHKAGQIQEADRLYTAILKAQPKHPDANHNMGVLAVSVGKVQEAPPFFRTALEANPSIGQYWLSYINALISLDRIADAISVLNQAKGKGAKGEAFDQLEQRLNSPNEVSIDPPQDQQQRLINLYRQGQFQQALDYTKQLLSKLPNSLTLYNIQGAANAELGQFDAAIDSYKQALEINPDYADAYYNMGNALNSKGDLEAAIKSYKQALEIKPDCVEAYYNMGNALKDKGDLDAAIDSYKQALKIKPNSAEIYYNIGTVLQNKDDLEAAIDSYKQALQIKPDYAEAHRHLSLVTKYEEQTQHVVQMKNLHQDASITKDQRCHLSFALAKVFEDMNDFDKSFSYLVTGNSLRKNQLDYHIENDIKLFSLLKNTYPKLKSFSLPTIDLSNEPRPIFILGMTRSGTSLVEQIISSHSKVAGAGELNYVTKFGAAYAEGLTRFNSQALLDFRMRYLGALEKHSDDRSIVTDKMPNNFKYIGLVLSAFPEAKIIHVKRNPAATCWSNYKHYFPAKGLGHCYELNDLVTYYGLYQELMLFWQEQFGNRIYNLNYDNLTINQEKETKALLQHLDLQWEEVCLSPQNNKRNVRTASQQQVRQQIYQGSSQKWRKFEPFVGGVFDSLMEFN